MIPGLIWVGVGVVLMALEAQAPGVFLIWLGLAALVAGLVTLGAGLGFAAQALAFVVAAIVSVGIGLRLRYRHHAATEINTQSSGLVGRRARALAFEGNLGRVRVGDSDWPARLREGQAAPDDTLTVVAVEGMTLVVAREVERAS